MVLLSKFRMFQTKVKQKLMIGLMAPVPPYYNPSCDSNTLTATRSNSREILNIKSSLMASFSRISHRLPLEQKLVMECNDIIKYALHIYF